VEFNMLDFHLVDSRSKKKQGSPWRALLSVLSAC
jgi:hypothetical protein